MPKGIKEQPLNAVEWVQRDQLRANSYNPNNVFTPEMKLLRLSILADGWTQPIVARRDGEIIDGFHRWTVAEDPSVLAMTGGAVPVVYLDNQGVDEQIMSTVRHNGARGVHHVLKMAGIVRGLIDIEGKAPGDLQKLLGMEKEEVDRLYDRGGMTERGSAKEFGKGWVPE